MSEWVVKNKYGDVVARHASEFEVKEMALFAHHCTERIGPLADCYWNSSLTVQDILPEQFEIKLMPLGYTCTQIVPSGEKGREAK